MMTLRFPCPQLAIDAAIKMMPVKSGRLTKFILPPFLEVKT
jgi:hypothetical protein